MNPNSSNPVSRQWNQLLITVISVLCCFSLVSTFPKRGPVAYTDMSSYAKSTIEYRDGRVRSTDGIEFGQINKGDKVIMSIFLPPEIRKEQSTLTFGINHAVTDIYFQDSLLMSYGADIDEKGLLICHHNYFVTIPDDAWGHELTVCIRATENKAFNRIAKLWLYPTDKAYHYYFDIEFGRLIIAIVVLTISLVLLLALPILVRYRHRSLNYLFVALFGIFSSVWMILAEGIQQFFEIDSYLITTFEFVAFIAQILPLCGRIMIEESSKRKRKYLSMLLCADTVFVFVICLLNYSNIMHFSVTVGYSTYYIAINGIVFVLNSFSGADTSALSRRLSMIGISILCSAGIFDVIRFNLYRSTGTAMFNETRKTFPLGVLIFFMLLVFSAILNDREMQEADRENRSRLMASQIQPHFLYNTLASIREIIFEDPQYAADILLDFTTYLRGAVRAMSDVKVISFSEELKNIESYVKIEKMRMGDRLNVDYQIECSDFAVPPLSIQPLVENSIKHGIYKRGSSGGSVSIRSYIDNNNYIVQIFDTGVGFDVEEFYRISESRQTESAGLKNVSSRLEEVVHASLNIVSKPDVCTTATVVIPAEYNKRLAGALINSVQ